MMDLTAVAGVSAIVAAVATVVGAILLGLFFSRGEPWGTLNDLASIVLMVAMLPVALAIAIMQSASSPGSVVVAGVGIVGAAGAGVGQALLVARRWTYDELLPWTLGFGAVIGFWYTFVGLQGLPIPDGTPLSALAIAAGFGYVAIAQGFRWGGQRHPLAAIGGILLLVASTAFLAWLGLKLVTGEVALAWPR